VPNIYQEDCDSDGIGDACAHCPLPGYPAGTIPPCACAIGTVINPRVSNGSPAGQGSGTLRWETGGEVNLVGFNVLIINSKGVRTKLNLAIIPCEHCEDLVGGAYAFIVPKHKNRQDIFVEMVRVDGSTSLFGPAARN
jgi:hypothetical protein